MGVAIVGGWATVEILVALDLVAVGMEVDLGTAVITGTTLNGRVSQAPALMLPKHNNSQQKGATMYNHFRLS
jgi:hypothetical protein